MILFTHFVLVGCSIASCLTALAFKKVLILINPYGGQKTAEKIYSGIPATMLHISQLQPLVKGDN